MSYPSSSPSATTVLAGVYLGLLWTVTRQSMCQILFNDKIELKTLWQVILYFFKTCPYKNTSSAKRNYTFPREFVSWFINKGIYCLVNKNHRCLGFRSYLLWLSCWGKGSFLPRPSGQWALEELWDSSQHMQLLSAGRGNILGDPKNRACRIITAQTEGTTDGTAPGEPWIGKLC